MPFDISSQDPIKIQIRFSLPAFAGVLFDKYVRTIRMFVKRQIFIQFRYTYSNIIFIMQYA